MRFYRQWVVWRFEEPEGRKPTKVPYSPLFPGKASVTNPQTWGSFEDAVAAFEAGGFDGIGFVLTREDPFAFIDLDDVWTPDAGGVFPYGDPAEAFARQTKIHHEFATYAELSPSGKGLHLIAEGSVERGRKRGGVEVYTQERFMTMTGNVYGDELPIVERQELLSVLWHQMGGPADIYDYTTDEPQKEDDNTVLTRMFEAVNGDKARDLYNGEWSNYYPSQSEADFALIDIIAYYSKNRFQITRIFGYSPLGQREKYTKRPKLVANMINRSFDRQLPPLDLSTLGMLNAEFAAMAEKANGASHMANDAPAGPAEIPDGYQPSAGQPGGSPDTAEAPIARVSSIVNPPGLVGELADFIYSAAPRPVHEIALVGALGLVAGIAGRSFNVSGTGLNQYLLLLAPTGTGKEAIARGIGKLITAAGQEPNRVPSAADYLGPGEIRSDAALLKWLAGKPCFVSISGEFGLRLKQMSSPNANGHEIGLKRVMLDLFNKSGAGEILNPMAYSDKDKNTAAINSPSFTMVGESTPHRFYQALDEHMAVEGLLPRFTVFEYDGPRPPLNEHHAWIGPNPELLENLKRLIVTATQMQHDGRVQNVEFTPGGKVLFDRFNAYCDSMINASNGQGLASEFWSRAHVKAMKLAATIAVGLNFEQPTIDDACGQWATDLVVRDVLRMIGKFDRGEVGDVNPFSGDEVQQHKDCVRVIRDLLTSKPDVAGKYGVTPAMHSKGVVPLSALQRRLVGMASFRKGRATASQAVKTIVQGMLDADELRQLPGSQVANEFQTTAKCYVVSNPSAIFE